MKYYSEKLKRLFDTKEACEQAEFKAKEEENREKILKERQEAQKKELAEQRKNRAAEVDAARQAYLEAQKAYKKAVEKFIADYGSYHYTSKSSEDILPSLFDLPGFFLSTLL